MVQSCHYSALENALASKDKGFFDKALALSNTYHVSQDPTHFGVASEASDGVCLVCVCVCTYWALQMPCYTMPCYFRKKAELATPPPTSNTISYSYTTTTLFPKPVHIQPKSLSILILKF